MPCRTSRDGPGGSPYSWTASGPERRGMGSPCHVRTRWTVRQTGPHATRIATKDRVERDELLEFVRPRHQATLVTTRKNGRPQLSPVTCGVDEEGRVVISTYPHPREGRQPPARPGCDRADPQRRLGRSVRAARRDRRGDRPARLRRAARRLLPQHLRRAPRLGRVPPGDARPGQVPDPRHHRVVGPDRHRRLPARAAPTDRVGAEQSAGRPAGHLLRHARRRGVGRHQPPAPRARRARHRRPLGGLGRPRGRLVARAWWPCARPGTTRRVARSSSPGRARCPWMLNSAAVFEWNTDKAYLPQLAGRGPGGADRRRRARSEDLLGAVASFGPAVVKPCVGAGGRGVVVLDGILRRGARVRLPARGWCSRSSSRCAPRGRPRCS